MGSFIGHVIPGMYLFVYGILLLFRACSRPVRAEGYLVALGSCAGVLAESITEILLLKQSFFTLSMHHAMYIGFIVAGVGTARYDESSLARSIAFLNEGVLFGVHATGFHDKSEQTSHMALAIFSLAGAACAFADYEPKWALMSAGLTMTQSCWLVYIAFLRYSPIAPFSIYPVTPKRSPHDVVVDACMLCMCMFVVISQVHTWISRRAPHKHAELTAIASACNDRSDRHFL